MSLKKCEKCGEDVEIAKAFCPECGNPFVTEEKRQVVSEFDKYAGTINFSDSAYNKLLSELNLDTSRSPEEEKMRKPEQVSTNNLPPQNKSPDQNKNPGIVKWIIIAAIGVVIFVFFVIVILIALYIYFY